MLLNLPQYAPCRPDDRAVRYQHTILTYGQLEECLAQCRSSLPYGAGSSVILIVMKKGIELVLAVLSVFFSKHIFCILDIHTPEQALGRIIQETGSNILFTDCANFSRISAAARGFRVNVVRFQFHGGDLGLTLSCYGNFPAGPQPEWGEDLSHILYTSGSTADPKGIQCSRSALLNFIRWECAYLELRPGAQVAQMSAPWFEPFLRDLFLPLSCGGCLCIPTKREELDPRAFADFIREREIDVIHMVPTMFRHLFLDADIGGRTAPHILLAGEMLYGADVERYYRSGSSGTLYNLYGPSETTMARFAHRIAMEDRSRLRVPVGRPLPGTDFWLIGEEGERVPDHESGEVVIRTRNGSYGYCDREQTRQSFTFFPDGSVAFRTGDVGRIGEDGSLELIGRRDWMRKIYGQKVYPEEIERVLNRNPQVRRSMAVFEGNRIAAVLEIAPGFSIDALAAEVNSGLIPYKRPHFIYAVDQIPVNKSGKLDRRRIQRLADIPYLKKWMI